MAETIFIVVVGAMLICASIWTWWLENGPESVHKDDKEKTEGKSVK